MTDKTIDKHLLAIFLPEDLVNAIEIITHSSCGEEDFNDFVSLAVIEYVRVYLGGKMKGEL